MPKYCAGERSCRGAVAYTVDCNIVASEFEPQSHYYIHFWTNAPRERYEPPYSHSYGLNSTSTVLLQAWL